jgi:hypothetical protein
LPGHADECGSAFYFGSDFGESRGVHLFLSVALEAATLSKTPAFVRHLSACLRMAVQRRGKPPEGGCSLDWPPYKRRKRDGDGALLGFEAGSGAGGHLAQFGG